MAWWRGEKEEGWKVATRVVCGVVYAPGLRQRVLIFGAQVCIWASAAIVKVDRPTPAALNVSLSFCFFLLSVCGRHVVEQKDCRIDIVTDNCG